MPKLFLESWSERSLQSHEKGNPLEQRMEITAGFVILNPDNMHSETEPKEVRGSITWQAPRTPDLRPADRIAWLGELLRSAS